MEPKNRLPVPCTAVPEASVRTVPGSFRAGTPGDGKHHRDGSGGGLQLDVVQPGPGEGDLPLAFLITFIRELLRNTVSGDVLALAMYAAQDEVPLTPEQLEKFKTAVFKQQGSYFPKGF